MTKTAQLALFRKCLYSAAILASSANAAIPNYTCSELPGLSGYETLPLHINNLGQIAGVARNSLGRTYAFYYPCPSNNGACLVSYKPGSKATGVMGDGSFIVGWEDGKAVRWIYNAATRSYSSLSLTSMIPPGYFQQGSFDTLDVGNRDVVGISGTEIHYRAEGGYTFNLGPRSIDNYAINLGVNPSGGTVVMTAGNGGAGQSYFTFYSWINNAYFNSSNGSGYLYPYAVNDNLEVVGHVYLGSRCPGGYGGFYYNHRAPAGQQFRYIGNCGAYFHGETMGSINNAGFAVGGTDNILVARDSFPSDPLLPSYAIIYSARDDQRDFLISHCVNGIGTLTSLYVAKSINNRGQIVGWGRRSDGKIRALLMNPR